MDYIKFRLGKICDMSIFGNIFVVCAIAMAYTFDRYFPQFDEETYDKKSTYDIYTEIAFNVACTLVGNYILRNLIEKIPSPLHNFHGYDHTRLKELKGSIVDGFAVMSFQTNLRKKIVYLMEKRLNV